MHPDPFPATFPASANKRRDRRIWENLAKGFIHKARALYANEVLGLDLENAVYGLDSTAIALSLTLFPWANFRKTKASAVTPTCPWRASCQGAKRQQEA